MMMLDNHLVGHHDNLPVYQLTLSNTNGQVVVIYNYGISVQSWHVKTRDNLLKDILLGKDEWKGYVQEHPNFGCIIGRYANRISRGELTLNGKIYQLSKNLNGHHLHGGFNGFGKKVWQIESAAVHQHHIEIQFLYISPDGEEGYPGTLTTRVIVRFTEENELMFDIYARSDQDTVCNISQHCYFNLGNEDTILNHEMQIHALQITETDNNLIPTGTLNAIHDTPFDFTRPKLIGNSIYEKHPFLVQANGFDVNYVLTERKNKVEEPIASVFEKTNRIQLEVFSSLPGLQLYTGNWLEGIEGKGHRAYKKFGGLCLEPQYFPDSPRHPGFPDVSLKAGQEYHQWIRYKVNRV